MNDNPTASATRSVSLASAALLLWTGTAAIAGEPISFRRDVAPILQDNCVACHGAKKAESGYRLDTFAELLKAGDSGDEPITAAAGQEGELLRRLTSGDESDRMPADSDPLPAEQIALIEKWIAAGAAFDGENKDQLLSSVIPPADYPDPPLTYRAAIPISAVAMSPDGTQILAGGYHEITVWDAAQPRLVRRIKNLGERIYAIAFHPDGNRLAVACGQPGRSGEVRLVDFATGQVQAVLARSADVAWDAAFRPNSPELAVASSDNLIRILNVETLETVRTIASHADWVTAVAWSADGGRLASASRDKSAKVFEGDTGRLLSSYQGHGAAVRGIALLPDGKQAVSVGSDGKIHRWEVEGGKRIAEAAVGGEGYHITWGDGAVLVPCADRKLLKFDLGENKITQEFLGAEDWLLSAAWHAPTARLVGGSLNGQLELWNSSDGSLLHRWVAKP